VIIFEKEASPGGKSQDYTPPDGSTLYLGGGLGFTATYSNIRELLTEYEVDLIPSEEVNRKRPVQMFCLEN